jgi:monoamine oxidase
MKTSKKIFRHELDVILLQISTYHWPSLAVCSHTMEPPHHLSTDAAAAATIPPHNEKEKSKRQEEVILTAPSPPPHDDCNDNAAADGGGRTPTFDRDSNHHARFCHIGRWFCCYCCRREWCCPCTPLKSALWSLVGICVVALLLFIVAASVAAWDYSPVELVVPPLPLTNATVLATVAVSGDNTTTLPNVMIIGAGTAGLFAAYTLEYLGVANYQILEASNHYGGRVRENTSFVDVPIDVGAEWIHGDPKILQDLLLYEEDRTNVTKTIRTISYRPQSYSVYTRGKRKRRDWFRFFYREFKFYNTTWYQYLRDHVVPRINVSRIVYNTVVESIDYSNETVRVVTTDGREFTADRVVLAVPLAVMDQVEFIPPLDAAKQTAMANVYVSPGIKAWLEFSHRFYPDIVCTSTLWGFVDESADADAVYFNAVYGKPSTRNVLAYFSVGTVTEALANATDNEIVTTVLAQLDTIFDGQATKYHVQHLVQNWYQEPYIRGAYSDDWINYDATIAELARPVSSLRVHFAGEHTEVAEENVATVHGAALSGRRAASQVVQDWLDGAMS